MKDEGGGWTVILNRKQSRRPVNFTRPWTAYQNGFGNPDKEYWIGFFGYFLNILNYDVEFSRKSNFTSAYLS